LEAFSSKVSGFMLLVLAYSSFWVFSGSYFLYSLIYYEMNILIDAHFLDKKKEGNRTFLLNLIESLNEGELSDQIFFLAVYDPKKWDEKFKNKNLRFIKVSTSSLLRYLFHFNKIIFKEKIDVIVTHYHLPFLLKKVKKILVVHDILPFTKPELFSFFFRKRFKSLLKMSVRKADILICGSEFTRKSLIRVLKANPSKIKRVVYGLKRGKSKKLSQENYILVVGRLDKRKNVGKIFEIVKEYNEKFEKLKIVLVGRVENIEKVHLEEIEILENRGILEFKGEVSDEKLKELFVNSSLLLYFSENEGFGYPIVEASLYEIPYLSIKSTSIEEIAIDESFVRLDDLDNILYKINRFLTDTSYREYFLKKAKEKVESYTLENMYKSFINILNELK